MIGVQVGRGLAAQRAIELGQRLVAEPDVAADQGAVRGGLGEQPAAGIMVEHGGGGALLVGAQAEGVVAVAGDPGGGFGTGQAPGLVVGIGLPGAIVEEIAGGILGQGLAGAGGGDGGQAVAGGGVAVGLWDAFDERIQTVVVGIVGVAPLPGIEAVADHPVEGVVVPAVVGAGPAAGQQVAGGVVGIGGDLRAQLLGAELAAVVVGIGGDFRAQLRGAELAASIVGAGVAQAVAEAAPGEALARVLGIVGDVAVGVSDRNQVAGTVVAEGGDRVGALAGLDHGAAPAIA